MDGPGFQHAVTDAASPRGAWRADRARPAGRDAVSQGSPLTGGDQAFFGAAFGHDFSKVRVHADRGAAASAAEARAHAYTVGDHVYFADGRYAPATAAGRQLLAHELAHVVQQGRGGGPGQADDARAQADADRAGRSAAGGGPATVAEARPVGMARQPADSTPAQAPGDAQAAGDAQAPADAGTRIEEALIRRLTGALVPGDVAVPVVIQVIRGMVHQLAAEHAGSKLWANLLTITPKGAAEVVIGYEAGAIEGLASPIGDLFGLVVFEEQIEAMARQVLMSILAGKGDLSASAQALAKEARALAGQIADEFAKLKARPAKETIADLLELPDALAGVAVHKAYDFGVQAGKDIAAALEAPWKAGEEQQKQSPSFWSMPATWTQSKYEELKGRLLSTPWLKIGNKIGYAVGWVAIQVILLFFTQGIGNAIEKVGAAIGRVGEFLGGLSKVIGQGAAKVAEFVGEIGKIVSAVEEAIAGVLKKLLKPLEPLLRPIRTFLKDLEGFLRKLLGIPEKEIVQAVDAAAAKAGRTLGHDAPPALPKPPEHVAPPGGHKPPEHTAPPAGHKPPEHTAPPAAHKPPEHVTPPAHKGPGGPGSPGGSPPSAGGHEGFTAEGPMVRVPVTKAGEPARVLEIGAGPVDTNLGLPPRPGSATAPDPALIDLRRTDIQPRPGVDHLDATKDLLPGHVGQYDTVIINNPRGYVPDIEKIGQAVRPGGRIIVQGKAELFPGQRGINPDFNKLLKQPAPPGFRIVEGTPEQLHTPQSVLGSGFRRTTGGPVNPPNFRIIYERIR